MALRLFDSPHSPFARKVKLALYEKGVPFEPVAIDPTALGTDPVHQDFVLASPRGEVPALADGDLRLAGSRLILDYLDERYPGCPLLPEDPAERARARALEAWVDADCDALNWLWRELPELSGDRRRELQGVLESRGRSLWRGLARELRGRAWLRGERFGRADVAAWAHLSESARLGLAPEEGPTPLPDWLGRCRERECVVRESRDRERAAESAPEGAAAPRDARGRRLEWALELLGAEHVGRRLAQGAWRLPAPLDQEPRAAPRGLRPAPIG